jgi:hypothetical protein
MMVVHGEYMSVKVDGRLIEFVPSS